MGEQVTETHAEWLRRQANWHVSHGSGRIGDVNYAAETLLLLDALEPSTRPKRTERYELIADDLRIAQEMFKVLAQAAQVEGVESVEIRVTPAGPSDTIVIGYGEMAEPAILDVIPAAE